MDHTPLVSAREALSWLGEPDVRFVDVTWFMPNVPSSAHDAYEMEHIPGASYFDIDKISDASIDLPHMYPSLGKFEYCVGNLGISESDRVVVYDRSNSLPRHVLGGCSFHSDTSMSEYWTVDFQHGKKPVVS